MNNLQDISNIIYSTKYDKFKIKDNWYSVKQLQFFIKTFIQECFGKYTNDYFVIEEEECINVYNYSNLINNVILKDMKRNEYHYIILIIKVMTFIKNKNVIHINNWNIKQKNSFFNTELYDKYFKDCNNMKDCISIWETIDNCNLYLDNCNLKNDSSKYRKVYQNEEFVKLFTNYKDITNEKIDLYFDKIKMTIRNKIGETDITGNIRCSRCSIFKTKDNYSKEMFRILCNDCSVIVREEERIKQEIEDNKLCDNCKYCKTPIKKDKLLCGKCYMIED